MFMYITSIQWAKAYNYASNVFMIGALNYGIHVIPNEHAKCMMYEERTDLDKKVYKGTLTELIVK